MIQKQTGRYALPNGDFAEVITITEPEDNGLPERYIHRVLLHKRGGGCIDVTHFALSIDDNQKLLQTCL